MGWVLFPIGVGWRDFGRTIYTGTFECRNPRCKGRRSSAVQHFKIRQHRNWLVALYIPILPLNRLGASVQCAACKSFYSLDALPEDELRRLTTGTAIPSRVLGQTQVVAPSQETPDPSTPGATFTPRPCPHCKAHMPRGASICPSCQRESIPWRFENGFWWTKGPGDNWYWLHEEAREWKPFEGDPADHGGLTTGDREEVADLGPLIKNSTAALPAFVMVQDVTRPGLNEALDVEWTDMGWLQASEDEEILGRWLCVRAMCHVGIGKSDGLPGALTSDTTLVTQLLFDGGGSLFLTSRRLVGWIGMGRTAFGPVGPEQGLLYTLPLSAIERLDVTRKTGLSGGIKDTGIILWNDEGASLFADLDRAVDDARRARSSNRIEAARAIVAAVAAIRRENATPEQGAVLKRALAGDWDVGEDGDLEIVLAPRSETPREPETPVGTASEVVRSELPTGGNREETLSTSSEADGADSTDDEGLWSCLACGASNFDEHRFCTSCGTERPASPTSDETLEDAEVKVSTVHGCQECDCVETPAPEDRFCRQCGHPVEAHVAATTVLPEAAVAAGTPASMVGSSDAEPEARSGKPVADAAKTNVPVGLEACWSCDSPIPPNSSACPHCGVSLLGSWDAPARVEAGGPVTGSLGDTSRWLSRLPFNLNQVWIAVLLLTVVGVILFGAIKIASDSSREASNQYTNFEQTEDYSVTDTSPYTATDSYTTSETDPYSTTQTETEPIATAVLGAPVAERSLSLETNDGYTGDLQVKVYGVFHADDFPPLPITYRNTIASCEVDSMTDAVIPISIQFQNTSSGSFSTTPFTVSLQVIPSTASPISYAGDVRYSDGDEDVPRAVDLRRRSRLMVRR